MKRTFLRSVTNASDKFLWGNYRFDVGGPRGFYNRTLDNEWVNLALATRDCPLNTPSLLIQLKAQALWSVGLEQSRQNAVDLMESVFEFGLEREIVNRVDLFADVSWAPGFKDIDSRKFVSRAKLRTTNAYGPTVSGFEIGVGRVHARIYNKSLEGQHRRKERLSTRWQRENSTPIWRVEFQFRRPFLAERRIDSFEDLLRHRQGLWNYASSKWLRMCVHSEGNQSRRPITKFWKLVQSARVDQSEGPVLMIPAVRRRGMKRQEAVRQIAGVVKSHCRDLGISEHSIVFGEMLPEIELVLSRADKSEKLRGDYLLVPVESSNLVN